MPLQTESVVARSAIVTQKFNFIVGTKSYFLQGPLLMDRTGENRLAPGRDYRRGVTVPSSAFPSMFLLS